MQRIFAIFIVAIIISLPNIAFGNTLPAQITLNSGDNNTREVVGTPFNTDPNKWEIDANNGFTYSTNGTLASYLTIIPADLSKEIQFYDCYESSTCGNISINANSNLTLNFGSAVSATHYNGSRIQIAQNASYTENGTTFRTTNATGGAYGYIANYGNLTLNISDYVLFYSGLGLENNGGTATITTKNVFNGQMSDYYGIAGIINLVNNSTTTINGNLSNNSAIFLRRKYASGTTHMETHRSKNTQSSQINITNSLLSVNGTLENGGYSTENLGTTTTRIYGTGILNLDSSNLNATNLVSSGFMRDDTGAIYRSKINAKNSRINITGNLTNRAYSDISLNNSTIEVAGRFASGANTNIFMNEKSQIKANEIDIQNTTLSINSVGSVGESVLFSATSLLSHNLTLGNINIYASDGSLSLFYSGILSQNANEILLNISEKTIQNIGGSVGLSGNSQKIVEGIYNDVNLSDRLKNMGANDIKTLGNNINNFMQNFTNNANQINMLNRSNIVNRLVKRGFSRGRVAESEFERVEYIRLASNSYANCGAYGNYANSSNFTYPANYERIYSDAGNSGIYDESGESAESNADSAIDKSAKIGESGESNEFSGISESAESSGISDNLYASNARQRGVGNIYRQNNLKAPSARNLGNVGNNARTTGIPANSTNPNANPNSLSQSLYASLLGGYVKNSLSGGYNYGLNVGYDVYVGDFLLGIYGSYVGENLSDDGLKFNTNNMQFGGYLRYSNSAFELDFLASYNLANNKFNFNALNTLGGFSGNGKYKNNALNVALSLGGLLHFNSNTLKLFAGAEYSQNNNGEIAQNGALNATYFINDLQRLDGVVGLEWRSFFGVGGYFFIRPEVIIPLFSNAKDTTIIFLNTPLTYGVEKGEIFGSLIIGGEGQMNSFSSIGLSGIFRASTKKSLLIGGMATLRFYF
ncbi:hypothetical protein CCY99_07730 [Helicobacter sp. 16-1353]|uniref:autotransporter outer membrane beta-barrel domain-containing protein n=1 Tax=Helicobacter sp. 16-1353 TaxID=2004996 RepID=UPI000DCE599B|nr:autotransporter outer membrane beta-barrel domain-containing protein [Helicobacter sp. 16-1353]RAX52271.1 hypothetical protein CCY99_07730 [Helicobacter sp. 16-1353]